MRSSSWPAPGPATPEPLHSGDHAVARITTLLWVAAGLLMASLVAQWGHLVVQLLRYPYEWSSMDGYFVSYGQRLLAGAPIYSSHSTAPSGFAYVPGYLAVLAPLNAVFGPGVWVERALALTLTLAVAALVGHTVLRRSGSVVWGLVAVALCLAPPVVNEWYLIRGVDLLVILVGFGATVLLAESHTLTNRRVVGAALLYVAGFYCKQTIVFPWAAGAAILFTRAPRRLIPFGAVTAAAGLLCAAALQAWSDGWFWDNVFATMSRHPYNPRLLRGLVFAFVPPLILVFGAAVGLFCWRPRAAVAHPWALFWGASLASIGLAGRTGSAVVYFLPAYLASVMWVCQVAPAWLRALGAGRLHAAVAGLAVAQVLWWFGQPLRGPTDTTAANAARLLEAIAARPGRLLVERADSFATLAGRPVEWEAHQLPILHKMQGLSLDPLLEELRGQEYAAVMYSGQYFQTLYEVRRAIFSYYEPLPGYEAVPIGLFYGAQVYTLLVPKPADEVPEAPPVEPGGAGETPAPDRQGEV